MCEIAMRAFSYPRGLVYGMAIWITEIFHVASTTIKIKT